MMECIETTLPNGLRVVARKSETPVSHIGVLVGAGSRDDGETTPGMAHFVEHTIFKGTRKRRSWHVSNRLECIGGELNAYTEKEYTMLYTKAPGGYEERAIELLADMIRNSTFPEAEVERERSVIEEEIDLYHDSPSDAVFDEFDELLFKGSPLAHNILGTYDSVASMTGRQAREFVERWYNPANMVMYCLAPSSPELNIRRISRHFAALDHPGITPQRTLPPDVVPFRETFDRGNKQANTIVGTRVFRRNDPRKYILYLLSDILGGAGMTSRLNQQLRERRGLVYTVYATVPLYSDCGAFLVYYGSDPSKVDKCEKLILNELNDIAGGGLSERAFLRHRDQYCGQILMGSENRSGVAMTMAKSIMQQGRLSDMQEVLERIRAISRDELTEVATLLADSPFSRLTII